MVVIGVKDKKHSLVRVREERVIKLLRKVGEYQDWGKDDLSECHRDCRRCTSDVEGEVGPGVYSQRAPLPMVLSPGQSMLSERSLLPPNHTSAPSSAKTSSSPHSLKGMVGRTRNSHNKEGSSAERGAG